MDKFRAANANNDDPDWIGDAHNSVGNFHHKPGQSLYAGLQVWQKFLQETPAIMGQQMEARNVVQIEKGWGVFALLPTNVPPGITM